MEGQSASFSQPEFSHQRFFSKDLRFPLDTIHNLDVPFMGGLGCAVVFQNDTPGLTRWTSITGDVCVRENPFFL